VDPPGCRKYIQVGELAKQKGLAIVAGTQRRHQAKYLENQHAVAHGAIGKIVGGCVWWCGRVPWVRWRDSSQSNADYLVNNWLNFVEMSGDHIVEQHVHNLDVANWFIGHPPVTALGFGGRARRVSGNSFDFFSIDFDYGEDCHIHSMCRQITGCYRRVSEFFEGTEGSIWGGGKMTQYNQKTISTPDFPEHGGPYVQEHIDLLNSIRRSKPLNEAKNVAEATLVAIMGRIACFSGKIVKWSELITPTENSQWSNLTMTPTALDFESTESVAIPQEEIAAIPGEADPRFKKA